MRICGRSPSGVDATNSRIEIEAAQLRHHVVDDQHVEGTLAEEALRLARACRLDDDVAGVAKRAAERLQYFFFVVYQENRAAVGHVVGLP